jgi:NAD(P)-dependent dehydrogenase (short-subunit alcohol dehydrogenase family)
MNANTFRNAGVVALASAAAAGLVAAADRRARRIDLRGRVVLVTGGGRGLGYATARAFAARGARLAICGRDSDVVRRAEQALRDGRADVHGSACDAADPIQVADWIAGVLARFGQIDVLVNNAGQCFVGPAADLDAADMADAMRNIFWSVYHPTMAVLPHLRGRRFGRIVNVTSIGGRVPTPHQAAYNAGKHAATGFSSTLAVELRKDGVRVSTVLPPPLDDGAPLHVHFNGDAEAEFRWFARTLTSPLRATGTERTAAVIVDAAEHGDVERAVSPLSWLTQRAAGAAPGLTSRLLGLVDRRLPPPGPPGRTSPMRLGRDVIAASPDPRVMSLSDAVRADELRVAAAVGGDGAA